MPCQFKMAFISLGRGECRYLNSMDEVVAPSMSKNDVNWAFLWHTHLYFHCFGNIA